MPSFKFVFDDVIRRVLIGEDGGKLTYSKLVNTLLNLFPSLAGKNFQLFWEDDEGDLVVCSSDAELDEAVNVLQFVQTKILKFIVKLPSNPNAAPASARVIHAGVTCDECGLTPIVGIRYKCTVRNDFDLCEACEAKKPQPHAMIKIFDPAQAPSVLVYGLKDDEPQRFGHGGRWRRGCQPPFHNPHGPPGHGFPPGPPPPAAGPFGPGPFGCPPPQDGGWGPWGHHGRGRKHCERWAKRAQEKWEAFKKDSVTEDPVVAPFVNAVDAVVNAFCPADDKTEAETNPDCQQPQQPTEQPTLEDELIEKAILESLLINENKPAAPAPVEEKPKPVSTPHVETARPAVPTLPKPALRFVKDATFPDGTIVQPGASFRKAWKVRNDGAYPWPEGSVLVSVGGDIMSNEAHKEPLPVIRPEEDAEIAVHLTAPDLPGMYTAYYRAQTKDQQYFGQRLWASIVVAESESDWQVVSEDKQKAAAAAAAEKKLGEGVALTPVPAPPATVPAAAEETKEAEETVSVEENLPAPPAAPQQPSAALRSAVLLWRRELEVLDAMGFSDPAVCIPLLQQYLGSPLSLSSDKNATPNVEGMQQVVATLLQM